MIPAPGIFVGRLRHRRFAPRPHQFEYSVFMALLDIDRVPETMALSRLTSHNRWNWAAFDDRDHLPAWPGTLRERLQASAHEAGEALPDGSIYLLTHLRYAGYVFNPVSFFYCHDQAGRVRLVLAEVSNTYGGVKNYWLRPLDGQAHRFRACAAKALYVSPFMETAGVSYEFALTPPAATLVAHMNVLGPGEGGRPGRLFDATLRLARHPWNARTIRRTLLRFPLMTATVIAAIHWQALRLRVKGLAVQPFPAEAAR